MHFIHEICISCLHVGPCKKVGVARIMEQPSMRARVHGLIPEKTAFVSSFYYYVGCWKERSRGSWKDPIHELSRPDDVYEWD